MAGQPGRINAGRSHAVTASPEGFGRYRKATKMSSDFATVMRRSQKRTRDVKSLAAKRIMTAALQLNGGLRSSAERRSLRGVSERAKSVLRRRRLLDVMGERARRPSGRAPRTEWTVAGSIFSDKAAFMPRHHEGPHGALDYRLYRPAHHGRPYRGVLLMLHGCTQSPEDFAVGTGMNAHAERNGLVIIYPEQIWSYNSANCWSWFRPGDQGRSGGEPALLADLVARVAVEHGVAPSRCFAAGLSAGGAMAAILGVTHPELFAAVGIHSGLACGSARSFVSAIGAMNGDRAPDARALRVPAIVFHGSADETVAPMNAGQLAGALANPKRRSGKTSGRRYDVLSGRSSAGHPVEVWTIDGAGDAWSGGRAEGSYTDPAGPDASVEMIRFFLARA